MKYIFISLFLFSFGFHSVKSTNALECLPTCSAVDDKFLSIAGTGLSTIVGAEIVVNLASKGANLEFGVFDGEARGVWDAFFGGEDISLNFELHADPAGDASGLTGPIIALWTGDGSGGLNTGVPMTDNSWSDFTFPNFPSAQAANGDFVYTLLITPIDPMVGGSITNTFKIRTTDMMYVPAMFPVTFIAGINGETAEDVRVLLQTLYPNVTCDDAACTTVCGGFSAVNLCDLNDPACCFFETTYDGMWSFFMNVPEGETALDVWDGDLDFGDGMGTVFDTDDPNTPGDPFIPDWSIGTDVVFEGAAGANPDDDNNSFLPNIFVRSPSVNYLVIDPLGNQYTNTNPSGDREWELYRLDTATSDPQIADVQVSSIPAGLWEVKLIGVDMSNLNSIVLPFDLRGEKVDDPDEPRPIPTLNEWGLITLATMGLFLSLFFIRRKRNVAAEIK